MIPCFLARNPGHMARIPGQEAKNPFHMARIPGWGGTCTPPTRNPCHMTRIPCFLARNPCHMTRIPGQEARNPCVKTFIYMYPPNQESLPYDKDSWPGSKESLS